MKIFKVVTVTTIKNVYYVPAEKAGHAADTVTLEEAEWDDAQQEHLNESIVSVEETTDQVELIKGLGEARIYAKVSKDTPC